MVRILISISCLYCALALNGQKSDLYKEISKIIKYDTEIDHDFIPGFSIGVIDGDSVFYVHFGSAERDMEAELNENLLFEIGSTSKVITSFLFQLLDSKGIVDLDMPVNDFLPVSYRNPRLKSLTAGDLINHRSGFSRLPQYIGRSQKNILDPYAHFSKEDLLTYYRDYVPDKAVGEFSYSHTNYALLEVIAEYAANKRYHDLLDEYVFSPLGMESSFVDFPEKKELTPAYNRALRRVSPWSFPSFAGSEGVKSTLHDLCLFVKVHLGMSTYIPAPFLDKMLQTGGEATYNDKITISNGWHVVDQGKDYKIYTHTGKTEGHSSFIAFVRETNTGVVILGNSSIGTADLGFLILRMINYNWKRKGDVK